MTLSLGHFRKAAGRVLLLAAVVCLELWTAAQAHAVLHLPQARGVQVFQDACCPAPGEQAEIGVRTDGSCPQACALCVVGKTNVCAVPAPADPATAACGESVLPSPAAGPLNLAGVALPPANGPPATV